MMEILKLQLELEQTRRAYWQSQQNVCQLLIEKSLAAEATLRTQVGGDAEASEVEVHGRKDVDLRVA